MAETNSLTVSRTRELLDYDPLTGALTWRIDRPGGKRAGDTAGGLNGDRYVVVGIDGRQFYGHRLAWLHQTGDWPPHGIDHIDLTHDHNWWANLRPATKSQNGQNVLVARCNSKSGVLGVCWIEKLQRWRAQITVDRRPKFLGHFLTLQEAADAYAAAKVRFHPYQTMVV